MIIESLGIYLPEEKLSTQDVVKGCARPTGFLLEEYTGIQERRVAGEHEFSIDPAEKAIVDCLRRSRHTAEEVELLICANVSRFDAPDAIMHYEPCTALRLKRRLGLPQALAFDVTNACAGMFTALKLVEVLLRLGLVRCAVVASGEYITHLTETAQAEIDGYLDPRIACLTLGDAGAAVLLESSPADQAGFGAIEIYTLSKYNPLCVAGPSAEGGRGAIMITDAMQAAAVGFEPSATHAADTLRRRGRRLDEFQHIIPHQTSSMTMREGLDAIAQIAGVDLGGRLINNLAHRGNTASTTHFVAIRDQVASGRIRSGDEALFCISGSGMVVGTALYKFDDLPERMQLPADGSDLHRAAAPAARTGRVYPAGTRVRIESFGTTAGDDVPSAATSRELAQHAAEACLAQSRMDRSHIDLMIGAGLYRSGFIAEPAAAAVAAGDLKVNDDPRATGRYTLALDVSAGAAGWLHACHLAVRMIQAGDCQRAMIIASDRELSSPEGDLRGIASAGSAVLLEPDSAGATGFGAFFFQDFLDYTDSCLVYASQRTGRTELVVKNSPQFENYCLDCVAEAVREFLAAEGVERECIRHVFPPQVSSRFVARLTRVLGIPRERIIDVSGRGDLFSSSAVWAFEAAHRQQRLAAGELGLFLSVGSGIQVGCALYHF